jgi:hypothetical protein
MINKHENINVGVYWDDVGVPGWKLSGWSNDIECVAEGETEDLVKEEVVFGWFAFFCMSLYTSLYGAMYYFLRLCNSDRERARDLRRDAQKLPQ